MNGVKSLLSYILDNYATIAACIALAFAIYTKLRKSITDWKEKSDAEKEAAAQEALDAAIEEAKKAVSVIILSICSEMEIKWNEHGSGAIRRSEVLAIIFEKYPILLKVTDQESLIAFIDEEINKALEIVRKTIRVEK